MKYPFKRISIFGKPGSGKSTFAYTLHQKTGFPIYHLDRYFFDANWVERDYQEFLTEQQALVNQETWIIEGNCLQSLAMRYEKADLVVYFNQPFWLCLARMVKRLLLSKNSLTQDCPDGCTRNISWKLIAYTWSFEKRVRPLVKQLQTQFPHVRFIEIKHDREVHKLARLLINS